MVTVSLTCDKCGTTKKYSTHYGKTIIRSWARKDGWSCNNKGEDLCPSCRKRKPKVVH